MRLAVQCWAIFRDFLRSSDAWRDTGPSTLEILHREQGAAVRAREHVVALTVGPPRVGGQPRHRASRSVFRGRQGKGSVIDFRAGFSRRSVGRRVPQTPAWFRVARCYCWFESGVPMKLPTVLPLGSMTTQTTWLRLLMPSQATPAPGASPPGGTSSWKPRASFPTDPTGLPGLEKPTMSPASLMPRTAEPAPAIRDRARKGAVGIRTLCSCSGGLWPNAWFRWRGVALTHRRSENPARDPASPHFAGYDRGMLETSGGESHQRATVRSVVSSRRHEILVMLAAPSRAKPRL